MSRNTVSPELHRNEALTCVVRTGFCKSYTEEIWPRMHRSGARGWRGRARSGIVVEDHHCGVPGRLIPGALENGGRGRHLVLYKLAGFCNDGISGLEGPYATCCLCHRGSQGVPPHPSAALRPDPMNAEPMDVWLTRPKGRSLLIYSIYIFISMLLINGIT